MDALTRDPSVRILLEKAKTGLDYVEEAPHRVCVMCQVGGAAVVLNGVMGLLDVAELSDHLIYYIVNCYVVFFGVVTCVTETHPNSVPALHDGLESVQRWMHEWAKGLTMLWGRGLFYIFQGLVALCGAESASPLGFVIGSYLLLMGVVCVALHLRKSRAAAPQEDYIKVVD